MASTYYMLPLTVLVQYLTNLGVIAAGATITTQVAGSVSTLATTYTDSTGLTPNPNPMSLNSAGRPAAASGAMTAFWVPAGTTVDVYFVDALGESWSIKNMSGINDPSSAGSLQTSLANPASSNSSGVGPVAGADLVANAVKSYDVIADVRAANAPTLSSGQTLNISVQGGAAINDGLGGDFYWNATSTATDNGTTVLKPNSLSGAGRWLRLFSPPFGAQSTIAAATTTDLGTLATTVVQVTGTATITTFGTSASLARPLYIVNFAAACTLAYTAGNFNVPGNTTLNVEAGDWCIAVYTAYNQWTILAYFRANSGPLGPQMIYKPALQSVVNSTTLTPDTTLTTTLQPGVYHVQLRLMFLGVGATTQGYKLQLNFGGTLSSSAMGEGTISSNGTTSTVQAAVNSPIASSAIADASTPDMVSLNYIVPVATAGTLAVLFAQNTSSANATDLIGNSMMIITKVS